MNHFAPEERLVFQFWDGQALVFADPMRVNRRMTAALDGDPRSWLERYNSDVTAISSEATERLVPAVAYGFELPEFDRTTSQGLLEGDALRILRTFLEWMVAQKKNTRELADLLGTFGSAVLCGRTLGYADLVGLHQNLGRLRLQQADAVCRGLALSRGTQDLERSIYDALEPLEETVNEAMFQGNSARMEARVKPDWALGES